MSGVGRTARPSVTVAIPTYNGEAWLDTAIESVLAQSLGDFELLILDNASTDGTQALVARYVDDPRVEYRCNPHNIGLAGNVNLACRLARGEGLIVLGADDRLEPRFLEASIAFLRAEPGVSMVHGPAAWIDAEGRRFGGTGKAWPRLTPGPKAILQAFESGFCFSTMLMRPEAIRACGAFDESWQQVIDLWLFVRLCTVGDIGYLDEVLCEYRIHDRAISMPMYRENLMFRRQIAAARECFAWPVVVAAGVSDDRRRAERAAARIAMRVLHMSRADGIGPMAGNFAEVLRAVPEAALWPSSWALFALALLPVGPTRALRRMLRRRAMARLQADGPAMPGA